MSYRNYGSSLALLLLVGTAASGSDLPLEELIEKHTRARGGRLSIESVSCLEVKLRIVEPTFEVEGLYRADRLGRMRIDIFSGSERVFSEGYDGVESWQWKGGASYSESTTPEAAAALRHGAIFNLLGLNELEEAGHRLRYLGRETLDGLEFHAVEITLSDGFKRYEYFDPETFLMVRSRSFRAFHPDVDPEKKWHETRFSDFREVGGLMRAFVQDTVDLVTGDNISTVTTQTIHFNAPLDPQIFKVP